MALLSLVKIIKFWPLLVITMVLSFSYLQGFANGEAKSELACLQQTQNAVARAIEQAERTRQANQEIAETFHKQTQQAETEIQIIEKEVIRYVDKHRNDDGCNLDPDGVQHINDLIKAANG